MTEPKSGWQDTALDRASGGLGPSPAMCSECESWARNTLCLTGERVRMIQNDRIWALLELILRQGRGEGGDGEAVGRRQGRPPQHRPAAQCLRPHRLPVANTGL